MPLKYSSLLPKGKLKTLPKDATALDFAFTLHSDMGYHCIAAKVNHRLVPISQKLQSGDRVRNATTSKSQSPKPESINFITTAKAKTRLMAALRKDRKQVMVKGEEIYNRFLKENNFEDNIRNIDKLLNHYKIDKKEELFYRLGADEISLNDSTKKLFKRKRAKCLYEIPAHSICRKQ